MSQSLAVTTFHFLGRRRQAPRALCSSFPINHFGTHPQKQGESNYIRLSKRMSELGICSRREASRILKESSECNETSLQCLREVIFLRGNAVVDGTAVKVSPDEQYIEVKKGKDVNSDNETIEEPDLKKFVPYSNREWEDIRGDTVILNKPIGYVSGQEEHQHVPAVRLLTRDNLHIGEEDDETKEVLRSDNRFHFSRKKWNNLEDSSIPKHIRSTLNKAELREKEGVSDQATLKGYAPAGRLDIDSTGVLIFTRAGIVARQLISPDNNIPKEYIVQVSIAVKPTKMEIENGLTTLPSPTWDLSIFLRGGKRLWNDTVPLKPVKAEWLDEEDGNTKSKRRWTMRLVLNQGEATMNWISFF